MHWNPAVSRSFHLSCITSKKLQKIRNLTAFVCVQTVQQNALFRNTVSRHTCAFTKPRPVTHSKSYNLTYVITFISDRYYLIFHALRLPVLKIKLQVSYKFKFKINWKNNGPHTRQDFYQTNLCALWPILRYKCSRIRYVNGHVVSHSI